MIQKIQIFFLKTGVYDKLEDIANSQSLNILWFGIGDNPYFGGGRNDLSNYSNALSQINAILNKLLF